VWFSPGGLGLARPALGVLLLLATAAFLFGHRLGQYQEATAAKPYMLRVPTVVRPLEQEAVDRVARRIAGRPVRMECEYDVPGGRAFPEAGTAVVSAYLCSDIAYLRAGLRPSERACLLAGAYPCPGRVSQMAIALHVFTHEAVHLRGIHDERQTDCYAIQLLPWTARWFGVPLDLARAFGRYHWAGYGQAPRNGPFPAHVGGSQYGSPECRPGGRYELGAPGGAWR